MYADAFGLLVFGPLLTSVSLSKNKFFDRLRSDAFARIGPFVCYLPNRIIFQLALPKTVCNWPSCTVAPSASTGATL